MQQTETEPVTTPKIRLDSPELSGGKVKVPPPKRPQNEVVDPAEEEAREEAFSEEPIWNGKPLEAFSVERYCIFVSQRLAMGAPPLYDSLVDGLAFYPDALRLLWLCSQAPSTLSILRRDHSAMQQAIEDWAEKNAPIHRSSEAVQVAIRIFNAASINRHEPAPSHFDGHGDDLGN